MPCDYSGQNLRGHSFRGQNLEGANFSGADIRGADFTKAKLRGANFTRAIAGLQKRWIVSFALVVLLGVILSFIVAFAFIQGGWFYPSNPQVNGMALVVFIIIGVTIVYKGLAAGLVALSILTVGALLVMGIFALFGQPVIPLTMVLVLPLVLSLLGAFLLAICTATSETALGATVANLIIIVYGVTFISGTWLGTQTETQSFESVPKYAVAALSSIWIVAQTILGGCIGWRTIALDEKFVLFHAVAIAFATIGGTSFRGADLTDANFTQAALRSTDLRNARITRTCWFNAKWFERARISNSYLKSSQVQQLVTTGWGVNQNFDHQNLNGINLKGASLQSTSLIGSDLSSANLQDTDLSRAKLVQTQLDGTDLTGATLTGACIEDWGITSHTILQNVRCDYVFMRSPTPDDPNPRRKPDNWNEAFALGDFADFIKPIVDTLDLYHNSGVDPRAIAISFKQLAENNPDAELRIVGMEVKGEDKFLLRAKTAPTADKSELSAEYFTIYNELKVLAKQELKALIEEKDIQIHRLENMVMTALERPSFYAQTYNNQGDTMPRKQSNFDLQGAQFGGGLVDAETVNAHQIGGNIYNSEQRQNPELIKTILILAANPITTTPLRLDEEVREIEEGLKRAKKRDQFDLKQKWAVRIQDVYRSLLDLKPQIVHFSGHGSGDDGLVLEDETGNVRLVDTVALAGLFELFANTVECVILNACYSEVQASAIATHISYVIGMKKEVGDRTAIKFATGFYSALGAGESVEFAYKLGCSVIQLDGIAEHLTPVLKKK